MSDDRTASLTAPETFTGTIIDAVAATSPAPVTRDYAEPLDAKRE